MSHTMLWRTLLLLSILCGLNAAALAQTSSPLEPFADDEHTLLLYHFDEGSGTTAGDASRHKLDGEIQAGEWVPGRFGSALRFNGRSSCVFRQATGAIEKLRRLTVECWCRQEETAGRQFLVGKDVTFHFDLTDGLGTSLSLYNQEVQPSDPPPRRHHQISTSLGSLRPGRWHHHAVTYDSAQVSFFLDGVLKRRIQAQDKYLLGGPSRGLWVGCYVGNDFWFSGAIDEVRVSDCVRYDPECRLAEGGEAFSLPKKPLPRQAVRTPQSTGRARLCLTLQRRFGGRAAGWVYLKPPKQKAICVGRYEVPASDEREPVPLEFDVSDELRGDGRYIVGLEHVEGDGSYSLLAARLLRQEQMVATWAGEINSRRTFKPPLLAPLDVGGSPATSAPARILLLPEQCDRIEGELELETGADGLATLFGQGSAEYWINVPREQAYRVYLRYAAPSPRPCDLVIDGDDLHAYNMCARNRTGPMPARDAFWEYQGAVTLSAGLHWLRLQDVLPEISALRLEPVAAVPPRLVSWQRYPVPAGDFLNSAASWQSEEVLGKVTTESLQVPAPGQSTALSCAVSFLNTAPGELFAGDVVRLVCRGRWDLEPFGKLTFKLQGQNSGHVISLWAIDGKGDEKLLWRMRDTKAEEEPISVPLSFEGNDVFDPGRVEALCWELDEGNVRPTEANRFSVTIADPVFHRRDLLTQTAGYEDAVTRARAAIPDAAGPRVPPLRAREFQPWTAPVVPEKHPLFAATNPQPVTRATLGHDLHMTGARSIRAETLDDCHKHYQFGDVCWPHIGICPQRANFPDEGKYRQALEEFERQLVAVRDRGLFLFDIWGYVPYHPDYPATIAPEHHEILLRVFGDRFLGYDNGEQDGRYIGGYADQGRHTNRREGWDDFVRWDEHICGDSMNYMNATGSLNFSHYYGERNCCMLGLETAQGLPSDTLMFAFLRGAGRQYGRLTYQATSIWNRFGYNMYHDRKTTGAGGYGFGPNKGCSRSLHKRLFFAGYLGGQSIFGTETAQFTADRLETGAPELSPLGRQHLELGQWAARHPDRGVLSTPVAFMLDFYHGWNMPRHLYRSDKYKIWGKLPYEKGDYLIDAVFRMVWPGYEDASYLRNERGFLTPTPYGDQFDVLTNRCHAEILRQYAAVMLLGEVEMTPELITRLGEYVREGGDLLLDARHARLLPAELTGVGFGEEATGVLSRDAASGKIFTEPPYRYTLLQPAGAAVLLTSEQGHPLVTAHAQGKGRIIVGAADYWMTEPLSYADAAIVNMEPPYRLLHGVQAVLGRYFDSFCPVEIDPPGLAVMSCCYAGDPKHLRIGLLNNELFADWRGTLRVRAAPIRSARELWRDRPLDGRQSIVLAIEAGDVAVIDLRLE